MEEKLLLLFLEDYVFTHDRVVLLQFYPVSRIHLVFIGHIRITGTCC